MDAKGKDRWSRLTRLLDRADRGGVAVLSVAEVKQLCRLYRQVAADLSRARTDGDDPHLLHYLNGLAARAHGHVYVSGRLDPGALLAFLAAGFPRLVRRHARPVLVATAVFVLSSLFSFLAVVRQPDLAYSLFDENMVEYENVRLEKESGEYKGNFTFGVSASPFVAVAIIANNIKVAVMAFGLGALCCVPGILLLLFNGRMLGTLSGVTWTHGFFGAFYSLVLTHGVLELSAICISGGAGLMLGWSLIAPGRLGRREALRQAAPGAFGLLAGAACMLVLAGLIEAFVTPHFPAAVRWPVAGTSAVLLAAYLGLACRRRPAPDLTAG